MNDHRDYAPPAVRNAPANDTGNAADYITRAVGYVERSLAKIDEQRAAIDSACEALANGAIGSASSQTPIDPIIDGLLMHLPRSGAVWPADERKQWLELFERTCNLVYKDAAPTPVTPTPETT